MEHRGHRPYVTSALDPSSLTQPYRLRTRWCVVTGAPCSGKTSVLTQLASMGFTVSPEAARTYITQRLSEGSTPAELRSDEAAFQHELIQTKLAIEAALPPDRLTLLDRGMPDSLTYLRVSGLDPNSALDQCFCRQYALVFLFDRLPLQQDPVRTEDEATAAFIDAWLENDYAALGYHVIRVPVMAIRERVNFVRRTIAQHSLQW